jgi:methylated-DNA-[protein]-cysteine S-methyltransferase
MNERGFALFDTAIGACGVAWGPRGVIGVQLPERDEAATRNRLARRFPEAREAATPPEVQQIADNIAALLRGEARDLSGVALDMDGVPDFWRRVYEVAQKIPAGATLTYGEVAARLGEAGAVRDVGQALGKNPFPIIVPCHRVVAASGKAGGFSARGGVATKLRLLMIENGRPQGQPTLFDRERMGAV